MFGFSYHSIILLIGVAVAGMALVAAIAVGPYGRRGVRMTFAAIAVLAFVGTAAWFTVYLGLIEQRRAIETRLAELRTQALGPGSPLACLEGASSSVEAACAQTIFAAPETLSAANLYTAARLDLFATAARYTGPRTPQFDEAVDALGASLQQDPFGLTANVLVLRKGCSAERCEELAIFHDATRLRSNIREKAFDANVARHAAGWRTPAAGAAPTAAVPAAPVITSTGETRGPIPEKYTLPSSASIPPVSIMTDEPARATNDDAAPPPAKERQSPQRQPASAARDEQAPAAAPTPAPPAKSAPPRQQKARPNAPLSIAPQ